MFGRRKQLNDSRHEKKKWQIELEEKNGEKQTSSSSVTTASSSVCSSSSSSSSSERSSSSSSPSVKEPMSLASQCGISTSEHSDSHSNSNCDTSANKKNVDTDNNVNNPEEVKSKKAMTRKYEEALEEENNDELLVELSEQDLQKLKEDEEEETEKTGEQEEEKESEKQEEPEENEKKKRKRYAWMDSDDEDVTGSSSEEAEEEEEEEEEEKEEKEGEDLHSREVSNSFDSSENGRSMAHNRGYDESAKQDKRTDNDIYEAVRFAYVTNINWEAKLSDVKHFLETATQQKVLSITPDMSYAGINNASPPPPPPPPPIPHAGYRNVGITNPSSFPPPLVKNNAEYEHKGRLYVEFISYQALQSALALSETTFMGRVIKVWKAYRRSNQFYLLQTPAHFRFFHSNMSSNKSIKKKVHKVDGGFNWAK